MLCGRWLRSYSWKVMVPSEKKKKQLGKSLLSSPRRLSWMLFEKQCSKASIIHSNNGLMNSSLMTYSPTCIRKNKFLFMLTIFFQKSQRENVLLQGVVPSLLAMQTVMQGTLTFIINVKFLEYKSFSILLWCSFILFLFH